MQENKVYPNHQVFVSVLDTLSKFGHLNPMLEVRITHRILPKFSFHTTKWAQNFFREEILHVIGF